MASSAKVLIPIFLLVSIVCTVSVIYGALEMSDGERSALEVLQDLINGKLSLKDIWNALTGEDDKPDDKPDDKAEGTCAGPDTNGVYEFDVDGNCVKLSCKPGYFEQGGICMQQRDLSDEVYEGNIPVNCVIEDYTLHECTLKTNGTCGLEGSGTQLREPNISEWPIGTGTCEAAAYVDCVVPCTDTCKVPNAKYTAIEGTSCMATTSTGDSVELGEQSGYCGTGTRTHILDPNNIDLEGTGFTNVQEYLNYANPNGICATHKPVVSVPCNEICTEGLRDVGCNEVMGVVEYIKDASGRAVCFDSQEAEAYIQGNLNRKPNKLLTILASDVRNEDGTYDVDNLDASERDGLYIKYRSDQGISYDTMVKNSCTLYSTEECQAPRESVDCVVGVTNTGSCITTCGVLGQKTLTYGITTYPFGEGDACPVYNATGYDSGGCQLGSPCPVDCVQSDWENVGGCVSNSLQKQTRTVKTNPLHGGDLCLDSEQYVNCFFGTVDRFNNENFYIKGKDGIYLGLGPQVNTSINNSMRWLRTVYGDVQETANKVYFTLDGPLTSVSIKAQNLGYCGANELCESLSKAYWKFESRPGGGYKISPTITTKTHHRLTINYISKVQVIPRQWVAGGKTYISDETTGWDEVFYLEKV